MKHPHLTEIFGLTRRKTPLTFLVFFLLGLFIPISGLSAAPVQPTDNTSAPYMALYGWNPASSGITHGAYTARWLNRSGLWIMGFSTHNNWENLEGSYSIPAKWLASNPGGKYILTQGMLPPGSTLAEGATGAYNSHWTTLAQRIVSAGLANNIIIRLGHEFNATWYTWGCATEADALNYAAYWRQIVTTIRAVPGTANIKFDWCGTNVWTSYAVEKAYPGDAYVDYIGCDIYDQSWAANTYPYTVMTYPYDTTAPTAATRQANAWAASSGTQNNGLAVWKNLAVAHGKPLTIPEWGSTARYDEGVFETPQHGGLDNPYYIQKMYDFIQDPANNVYYHSYFDIPAGDGHHQLTQLPGESATEFPNAAKRFRELFGLAPLTVNTDIGTVGLAGACTPTTVTGAGAGFLTGTSDNFHYAARAVNGDDMFMAQITSASAVAGQSGVMLRQSAAANSPYAALFVSNGNLIFQTRTSSGGTAVQNNVINSVAAPVWLKLLRRGNVISGYRSSDGLNWSLAGSQTVSMTASAFAGVAASSGNTTSLNTVGIDYVDNADINALAPAISNAIFLDESATSGVVKTGSWTSGTDSNAYNGTNSVAWTPGTLSTIKFTPTIATAGNFDVYVRWLASYNRGYNIPITVTSASGTASGTVNEMIDDKLWCYLGTFNMAAGTSGNVLLSNSGVGYSVGADAALFVPVPVSSLPSPKVNADFGGPSLAGSAGYAGGVYTINAGGLGFWSAPPSVSDQFHYVYQGMTGSQTLIARVTGLGNTSTNATAGLMFRGSTAVDAQFVQVQTGPTGKVLLMFRNPSATSSSSTAAVSTNVTPSATTPIWLKLVNAGGAYSAYYSTQASGTPTTWTQVGGTISISLPSSYLGGMAVHSHSSTALTTATFDNVTP